MLLLMPLTLTTQERERLLALERARSTPLPMKRRARIVLLASQGLSNGAIAQRVACNIHTVRQWRNRMAEHRLSGLEDRPKSGRPSPHGPDLEAAIIAGTRTPPPNATRWSASRLAAIVGTSASTVLRTWHKHGLAPHRVRSLPHSTDPHLPETAIDIVGLYLHPPEAAIVLSVEEKSPIHVLARIRSGRPFGLNRLAAFANDDRHRGTATTDQASGTVNSSHHGIRRHQEYLAFLIRLDVAYPRVEYPGRELHLIAEKSRTHNHAEVRRWLKRRPRFVVHFTPSGGSCRTMVEVWFGLLTYLQIRRDSVRGLDQVRAAIDELTPTWKGRPKAIIWTKRSERTSGRAIPPP